MEGEIIDAVLEVGGSRRLTTIRCSRPASDRHCTHGLLLGGGVAELETKAAATSQRFRGNEPATVVNPAVTERANYRLARVADGS
jgi:hypothetical protein